jgi:hypothetical protein
MTVEMGSNNVNSKEYKLISQLLLFRKTAFEMVKHILGIPLKFGEYCNKC